MCNSVVHVCILFSHLIIFCSHKRCYLASKQIFSGSIFLIVHCEDPWIIYTLYSEHIWKTVINFLLVSSLMFIAAVPKCFANVNLLTRVPLTGRRVNFILVPMNYETRKRWKISLLALSGGGTVSLIQDYAEHCPWLQLHRLVMCSNMTAVPTLLAPPKSCLAEMER